jgi:hypothetical protein
MNRFCAVFLIVSSIILLAACSTFIPQPLTAASLPTEDTTYLTPIPEATIDAFKEDQPVKTRLEAALYAIKYSNVGHFVFNSLPKVVSVEKLSIADAKKRVARPGYSGYDSTNWGDEVWLVVLEGEIQIYPPPPPGDKQATLPPPFHGCNFFMFDVNPSGGGELGSIACPTQTP